MNTSRPLLILTGIISAGLALWCIRLAREASSHGLLDQVTTYSIGGQMLSVLAVACCAMSQMK